MVAVSLVHPHARTRVPVNQNARRPCGYWAFGRYRLEIGRRFY